MRPQGGPGMLQLGPPGGLGIPPQGLPGAPHPSFGPGGFNRMPGGLLFDFSDNFRPVDLKIH